VDRRRGTGATCAISDGGMLRRGKLFSNYRRSAQESTAFLGDDLPQRRAILSDFAKQY